MLHLHAATEACINILAHIGVFLLVLSRYGKILRREGPLVGLLVTGTGMVLLNQVIADQVRLNAITLLACCSKAYNITSHCTGHSRWLCASFGLGQVRCHLLCSLSGCQNRSCQGRPLQGAVHPDGYHWSNRCLCVRRQLSWCGFLWSNKGCADPSSHAAGFHSCVELLSAGPPSLFTASVRGTHMDLLQPPCLVYLIQVLVITAPCIAAYTLAHMHWCAGPC